MKKQKILNIVMVVLIAIIVVSGVLAVGALKGWFTKSEDAIATINQVSGIVNVERGGVGYRAEEGAALLPKDILETLPKASATFDGTTMDEQSEVQFGEDGIVTLNRGTIFTRLDALNLMDGKVTATDAVYVADMRDGSGSILVLAGTVTYEKDGETYTAKAGEQISILENDISVTKLDATALNEFAITQAKNAKETLCFTADDLDKVLADREAERQAALETSETIHIGDEANADSTEAAADSTGKDKDKNSSAAEAEDEDDDDKGSSGGSSSGETSGSVNTCTIQIRCDTILSNLENLEPSKAGYVPGNGVILTPCTVEFEEGETVFDVLCRVCNYFGIQLEYSWTPIYNSYYIEGINNLYEFDCGNQSGWMYKVNGWFPNYGCSSYTLKNGDNIVWCYTCNGLGADVGASMG